MHKCGGRVYNCTVPYNEVNAKYRRMPRGTRETLIKDLEGWRFHHLFNIYWAFTSCKAVNGIKYIEIYCRGVYTYNIIHTYTILENSRHLRVRMMQSLWTTHLFHSKIHIAKNSDNDYLGNTQLLWQCPLLIHGRCKRIVSVIKWCYQTFMACGEKVQSLLVLILSLTILAFNLPFLYLVSSHFKWKKKQNPKPKPKIKVCTDSKPNLLSMNPGGYYLAFKGNKSWWGDNLKFGKFEGHLKSWDGVGRLNIPPFTILQIPPDSI